MASPAARRRSLFRIEACIVPQGKNAAFMPGPGSYQAMLWQMKQDGIISTRSLKQDAVRCGEPVFNVNSAYSHNHGGHEVAQAFYAEAYRAAVDIISGEQYNLSAVMHADERNRGMSKAHGYDVCCCFSVISFSGC